MKSILLSVGMILTGITASLAQQKVDKYCEVVTYMNLAHKVKTIFSGGNVDSLFSFKDSTIINNLIKVNEMKTVPDIMNYMSSIGWAPASILGGGQHIIFRRTFDLSELVGH